MLDRLLLLRIPESFREVADGHRLAPSQSNLPLGQTDPCLLSTQFAAIVELRGLPQGASVTSEAFSHCDR